MSVWLFIFLFLSLIICLFECVCAFTHFFLYVRFFYRNFSINLMTIEPCVRYSHIASKVFCTVLFFILYSCLTYLFNMTFSIYLSFQLSNILFYSNNFFSVILFEQIEIDWDNISRSPPPMKPARDINMATQSEIGSFSDEKQVRIVMRLF